MMHELNILVHVIAGILGIFVAGLAYATQKRGAKHKLAGRVFLLLMAVVIITAFNGVLFFRDRPFLTIVTFQSLYTTYSGFRVLKTKEKGFALVDFIVMCLVLVVTISFIWRIQSANILWHNSILYSILSYLLMIIAFDMLRFFRPQLIKNPRFWVYDHIFKMTGSFSALISAGAGTVMAKWEPYNQIIPAIFTTIWLIGCLIYFSKYAKSKQEENQPA